MRQSSLIINDVKLENFRCHKKYSYRFEEKVTKILGPNGCGKTSILEAIYIIMRGKSFRSVDRDILKYGEDFYRIELSYANQHQIIAFYKNDRKTFLINDKKTARLPREYRYPVVIFEPSDLHMISASPSRHRSFFDRIFGQLNPEYSIYLSRYQKALQQRNKAIKDDFISIEDVFPWNVLLAEYGTKIQNIRRDLTDQINQRISHLYQKITDQKDIIKVQYNFSGYDKILSEEQYLHELEQSFERDRILGYTNFGVHRDCYDICFNDKTADNSASRGESRSIILALKFIESELIYQQHNMKPLILLDDVYSELDTKHQKSLTDNFQDHQVILTGVE